jgi:UDP-N-acetylglucosamine 2-epimerase (non-hydrolysing)
MAVALAAFHRGIKVGHVEAGLRTGNLQQPFPEEANRRIVDVFADSLFAPTDRARRALLAEGLPEHRVHVTGNTCVDALERAAAVAGEEGGGDEVLITVHRRESFGEPIREIFGAIRNLAEAFPHIRWIYPVHRNPNVRAAADEILVGAANLELHEPFDYLELVGAMRRARLILTDSGGIQEEAPTFGTPVLVLRRTTERPEGVDAGVSRLVGTDRHAIMEQATLLLTDEQAHRAMSGVANPYGDGRAAVRIAAILAGEPYEPFAPAG